MEQVPLASREYPSHQPAWSSRRRGGILKELEAIRTDFLAGIRSSACPLVVNDPVRIVGSAHGSGSVISIEGLDPELTLLVELGSDGSEQLCSVSDLRFARVDEDMTVNERLYVASVMELFDQTARDRDRSAMIRILRLVDVASPELTADPILKRPGKYGY